MITGRAVIRGRARVAVPPPSATVVRTITLEKPPATNSDFLSLTWVDGNIMDLYNGNTYFHSPTTGGMLSTGEVSGVSDGIVATPNGHHVYMTRISNSTITKKVISSGVTVLSPVSSTGAHGITLVDGDVVVSQSGTGNLTRYVGDTSTVKSTHGSSGAILSLAWTGRYLVRATNNTVRIRDGFDGVDVRTFTVSGISAVAWDGSNLATMTKSGVVQFYTNEAL